MADQYNTAGLEQYLPGYFEEYPYAGYYNWLYGQGQGKMAPTPMKSYLENMYNPLQAGHVLQSSQMAQGQAQPWMEYFPQYAGGNMGAQNPVATMQALSGMGGDYAKYGTYYNENPQEAYMTAMLGPRSQGMPAAVRSWLEDQYSGYNKKWQGTAPTLTWLDFLAGQGFK